MVEEEGLDELAAVLQQFLEEGEGVDENEVVEDEGQDELAEVLLQFLEEGEEKQEVPPSGQEVPSAVQRWPGQAEAMAAYEDAGCAGLVAMAREGRMDPFKAWLVW